MHSKRSPGSPPFHGREFPTQRLSTHTATSPTTYVKPTHGIDTVFHVIYIERKMCLKLATPRDKRNTLSDYLEARGTSLPSYSALRKSKGKSKGEVYYLVGINKKTLPPIPKETAAEYYGSILTIINFHERPLSARICSCRRAMME